MNNIKCIDDSLLYNKKTLNYYLNKFKNKKCLTSENYLDIEENYYSDNDSDKTNYEKINTKKRNFNNIHSKKKISLYKDDNFNGSLHIFKNNKDEYEYKRINGKNIIKYCKKVNKNYFNNNMNIFIDKNYIENNLNI